MRPVLWSAEARRDYLEIMRYIARNNPSAAMRVADAIEKTGDDLGDYATGRSGRVAGTYEKPLFHLPYIIAYTLAIHAAREAVIILRIIHAARDWPSGQWPHRFGRAHCTS